MILNQSNTRKSLNNIVLALLIMASTVILPFTGENNIFTGTLNYQLLFLVFGLPVFALLVGGVGGHFSLPNLGTNNWSGWSIALSLIYLLLNYFAINGLTNDPIILIEFLALLLVFLLVRKLNNLMLLILLGCIGLSATVQSVYGLLQLYGVLASEHSLFPITGSFFNPGPFAIYLAGIFPVLLYFYLHLEEVKLEIYKRVSQPSLKKLAKNIAHTIEYALPSTIALIIITLPATKSRAAWVSVGITSLICLLTTEKYTSKIKQVLNKKYKLLVAVALLVVIVAGLGVGLYQYKQNSADGRLVIWKSTFLLIQDNPIWGVGYGNFAKHYLDYQAIYLQSAPQQEAILAGEDNFTFSTPLRIWAETGTVGLVLIIVTLLLLIRRAWNAGNRLQKAMSIGIIGIIVASFFSYPEEILAIKLLSIIYLAILVLPTKKQEESIRTNKKMNLVFYVILLSSIAISTYSIPYYSALKAWNKSTINFRASLPEASIKYFELAYSTLQKNGQFLQQYGKALSLIKQHEKAIELLTQADKHTKSTIIQNTLGDSYLALGKYRESELAYKTARDYLPSRMFSNYLLAKLYVASGDNAKAKEQAQRTLNLPVKVKSQAVTEIQHEMNQVLNNDLSKTNPGLN